MADRSTKRSTQAQLRSTAVKHALSIEEKKKLKTRVADLVLKAYDLPSSASADPAHPAAADASLFKECLSLFQPSDLNDLIQERNIDDRCGYALCPRPNLKVTGGGEKVWNQKGGKDFKIVARAEMERWCSKTCGTRTAFVNAQLSSEPSWLRETQNSVRLLDEFGSADDLSGATQALAMADVGQEMVERLQALSLERGEGTVENASDQVSILEKTEAREMPIAPSKGDQSIEGHYPLTVRLKQDEVAVRRGH